MRTDLYRDPKVCVIADILIKPDSELSRYVSQNLQCDMSITRNVMRNVTVGALVAVWGVLRHRGKRIENDLFIKCCNKNVIDDLSEVQGFGEAMEFVGWVQETDEGIVLPNFFEEHNVDPLEELRRKSAERQRKFREKNKDKSNVTVTLNSNYREEKRREDINTPIPPDGGKTDSKKKTAISLQTFLDNCKTSSEKPIPENDPVFDYAESVGLTLDILRIHWHEFKSRYTLPDAKRYKNWRDVYRKSVRGNWFKIWYIGPDGSVGLTTVGIQAQRASA